MFLHTREWRDLLIVHKERYYLPCLLWSACSECCSHWTPSVCISLEGSSFILNACSTLWTGTTTLLALDLKRHRSTVLQAPAGSPTPRFSAESQATEGDFEKQPSSFDNVSAAPIRNHAEPVLPPASPDIEGKPVNTY